MLLRSGGREWACLFMAWLFVATVVLQFGAADLVTVTGRVVETNEGYELRAGGRIYLLEGEDLFYALNRMITVTGILERDDTGREFLFVDSYEVVP